MVVTSSYCSFNLATTAGSASVVVSPKRAAVGDIAQQAAHDFAAAGLGQLRGKKNLVRPGDGPDFLGHMRFELIDQSTCCRRLRL